MSYFGFMHVMFTALSDPLILLYSSHLILYCVHKLFNPEHCVTVLPLGDTAVKLSTHSINSSSCSLAIRSSPIKSYRPMHLLTNPTVINWIQPRPSTNLPWNNSPSCLPSVFIPPLPKRILREIQRPLLTPTKLYLHCTPYPIKRRTNKNVWIV